MNTEDEQKVISQSWNKLSSKLYKEGFREGSAAGREKTFQSGFDIGYEEGFRTGYHLGNHNGILRILEDNSSIIIPEEADCKKVSAHMKPFRGLCHLCPKLKKEEIEETDEIENINSVQELITNQRLVVKEEIDSHLKPLYSKLLEDLQINISVP